MSEVVLDAIARTEAGGASYYYYYYYYYYTKVWPVCEGRERFGSAESRKGGEAERRALRNALS